MSEADIMVSAISPPALFLASYKFSLKVSVSYMDIHSVSNGNYKTKVRYLEEKFVCIISFSSLALCKEQYIQCVCYMYNSPGCVVDPGTIN